MAESLRPSAAGYQSKPSMKWAINKTDLLQNLTQSMRNCQYRYMHTTDNGEHSYSRVMYNNQPFPRFHMYVSETEQQFIFSLHLDQKKPVYEGQTAHSADYDEPAVAAEYQRIISSLNG